MNTHPIIKMDQMGFNWATADPFLFCVHHDDAFPEGKEDFGPDPSLLSGRNMGSDFVVKNGFRMYHGSRTPGFPSHPHRGFETITIVRKGFVDHSDSLGASGRYGGGDVQWMTAGAGIQHSEMFPLLNMDKENPLELFQIWLNLPAADKMVSTHFKMLWTEDIPEHVSDDGKTRITVNAGAIGDTHGIAPPPDSWAAKEENHLAIWCITMEPFAKWELPLSVAGLNRTLYYFKGNGLKIENIEIPSYHSLNLVSDRVLVMENGEELSELLFLQGKPIGEPIEQHGPFVMNTPAEIQQAFSDYEKTRFGGWPWPTNDPVHGRGRDRFARHADGREERPGQVNHSN
jgi:quercetin 2,3-dioxygenase